uniref:WW domain-containing protein n=1 Tax=Macrostomum lignano TaxID=282301 RepID=A0A1I8FD45_9PLAT
MNGSAVGPDGDGGDQHDELPALSSPSRQRIRPVLNRIDELRSTACRATSSCPWWRWWRPVAWASPRCWRPSRAWNFPRGTGMVTTARCALQLSMQWNADRPEAPWHGRISYKDVNGHKVDKELKLAWGKWTEPHRQYVSSRRCSSWWWCRATRTIETVEALSLAKEADAAGRAHHHRVLTCPDMVNKGGRAGDAENRQQREDPAEEGLRDGEVPQPPEELNNGVTLSESVPKRGGLLQDSPALQACCLSSIRGHSDSAADKLTEELFESVKRNISTRCRMTSWKMRKKFQEELQRLGQPVAETKDEKRRYLFEMLSNFNKDVAIATQGEMNARFHLYAKCRKHWTELGKQIHRAWPGWVTRGHISHYWQPPEQVTRLITDLRGRELASYDHVTDVVHLIAQKVFGDFQDIFEVVTETSNEEIAKVLELARADLSGRLFLQEARVFSQGQLFQERIAKIEEDLYKNNNRQPAPPIPTAAERIRRVSTPTLAGCGH